jgi:uncharacterized membrane protein
MRDRDHVAWLYAQLPGLVDDETLSPEAAEKLRRRFGELAGAESRSGAIALFGVVGAALVGGGVILLLAHNWDDLSRTSRAILSFMPLLCGQALAAFALFARSDSVAWRESAGAFLALAVGASIALVAQTYNLGGDFGDFMLSWTLLALPTAYVLRATLPALLYLIGVVSWAGVDWNASGEALLYFPLVALALPWWVRAARGNPYRAPPVLFGWFFALTAPIGVGFALQKILDRHGVWMLVVGAFAAALFLAGCRWWGRAMSAGQRPLQTVGALGASAATLAFSFEDLWRSELGSWRSGESFLDAGHAWAWLAAAGICLVWAALWLWSLRDRQPAQSFLGAVPLVTAIGIALTLGAHAPLAAMLLFNLYLLALSVGLIVVGFRNRELAFVNGGMLLLSAAIVIRFFDADIGFVARGVAFIALGLGFLAVNLLLLRRKGAASS